MERSKTMVSIPVVSSALLLLALLFLTAEGRSTSPWKRYKPSTFPEGSSPSSPSSWWLHPSKKTQTHAKNPLVRLPLIRGGESSSSSSSSSLSSYWEQQQATETGKALPTPASQRIGDGDLSQASSETPTSIGDNKNNHNHNVHQSITGGHILKAGSALAETETETETSESHSKTRATSISKGGAKITVESFVAKQQQQQPPPSAKAVSSKAQNKESKKRHKQIAKKLKNRNATNKRRKFMHFSWGMVFAALNHLTPRAVFLPSMTVVTGCTLTIELLRYRKGFEWINNALHYCIGKALRKNEMDGKFTGSLYYFSGVLATSYLYPKSCATLGICQLAIADPTASYFGRQTRHVYWSRIGNGFFGMGRNKGLLGFLGGGICCVPLNYRLLSLAIARRSAGAAAKTIGRTTILAVSLALGLAGAFADLIVPTPALTLPKTVCGVRVPPFHLDDNIVVPILSGWACVRILAVSGIAVPPAELALARYLVV